MTRLSIIICMCLLWLKMASQPNLVFAEAIGNSSQEDRSRALYTDASGNCFLTGSFTGITDFDPSAATATLSAAGQSDIFFAKYNNNGVYQWAFGMGGILQETGYSVNVDNFGNIFITGRFEGTVDFDPSVNFSNLSSNGSGDIFVAKYNSNGAYQWAIAIGSVSDDAGLGLSNDAQGNCYITGYYNNALDFDASAAVYSLPSTGQDAFVAKYNAGGLFQWAIHLDGSPSDAGESIKCAASGNCCLTGSFVGTADFDPSPGIASVATPSTSANTFLAQYDNNGNYNWAFNISSNHFNRGNALALDAAGNIFVIGTIGGGGAQTADFDPSGNTALLPLFSYAPTTYLAKYSSSGIYQWAFLMGGASGIDRGNAINCDASGACYISGYFGSLTDFDPSPAISYLWGSGLQFIYVAKYDNNGAYQWAFRIGNSFINDVSHNLGIGNDLAGNTYLTGPPHPPAVDFDPNSGTYNLSGSHVFLAKYSSCGAPSPPTVLTNSLSQIICANTSTSLSAIGSGTIGWFASPSTTASIGTGTTLVTPVLSTGIYTFYAGAITCTNSVSKTAITVTVNALPNLTITSTNSLICRGESSTITANGALTYTWNNSGSNTFIAVSPSVTTTYTVKGSDGQCANSSVVTLSVDLCLNQRKTAADADDILFYPVPAESELSILIRNHEQETMTGEIRNELGQLIQLIEMSGNNQKTILNVRQLQSGIYLIHIRNGNSLITKRFAVSR